MNEPLSYLTQNKLKEILKQEPSFNFLGEEVSLEGSRLKFDFLIENKQSGRKVAVEFDGYAHYTEPDNILRDIRKQEYCKAKGIDFVQIPYWIQLTKETFTYFFKTEPQQNITTTYPHGFVDKKAKLPSTFCSLGVKRFTEELNRLPETIKADVIKSLEDMVGKKKHREAVYPLNLKA